MSAFKALGIAALIYCCSALNANNREPKFRVIAFFTAKEDQAHISFLHEAERWFQLQLRRRHLSGECLPQGGRS